MGWDGGGGAGGIMPGVIDGLRRQGGRADGGN